MRVLAVAVLGMLLGCNRIERFGDGEGTLSTPLGPPCPSFYGQCDCSQTFLAGDDIAFVVEFPVDVRCAVEEEAHCEVELDGTSLRVHSEGRFELLDDCDQDYTTYPFVVCTSPPLAAGEYTVLFGEQSDSLRVPSMPCSSCDWTDYDPASQSCFAC